MQRYIKSLFEDVPVSSIVQLPTDSGLLKDVVRKLKHLALMDALGLFDTLDNDVDLEPLTLERTDSVLPECSQATTTAAVPVEHSDSDEETAELDLEASDCEDNNGFVCPDCGHLTFYGGNNMTAGMEGVCLMEECIKKFVINYINSNYQ